MWVHKLTGESISLDVIATLYNNQFITLVKNEQYFHSIY